MMNHITDALPERLRPVAKVAVPALLALVAYVVNGVATGDWTPTDALEEALAVLLTLVVVYAVPNR